MTWLRRLVFVAALALVLAVDFFLPRRWRDRLGAVGRRVAGR